MAGRIQGITVEIGGDLPVDPWQRQFCRMGQAEERNRLDIVGFRP
jgi:hypothetical protein